MLHEEKRGRGSPEGAYTARAILRKRLSWAAESAWRRLPPQFLLLLLKLRLDLHTLPPFPLLFTSSCTLHQFPISSSTRQLQALVTFWLPLHPSFVRPPATTVLSRRSTKLPLHSPLDHVPHCTYSRSLVNLLRKANTLPSFLSCRP